MSCGSDIPQIDYVLRSPTDSAALHVQCHKWAIALLEGPNTGLSTHNILCPAAPLSCCYRDLRDLCSALKKKGRAEPPRWVVAMANRRKTLAVCHKCLCIHPRRIYRGHYGRTHIPQFVGRVLGISVE